MECPRCDGRLERYALGGREAVSCDRCGFIGVPVEHRGELRDGESWADAITRFNELGDVVAGTVETSDAPTPEFDDAGDEPQPTVVRVETPASELTVEAGENAAMDADGLGDAPAETGDGVTCDVCGKRFDAVAQRNGHMAVHEGEERLE